MAAVAEPAAGSRETGGRFAAFLRHVRRYASVGVLSTATDFTVLVLLTRHGQWTPYAANLVSRPSGGLVSFVLNKLWTFERREVRGTGQQAVRYVVVWLSAYVASSVLVWVFSRHCGLTALLSKIAAEIVVCPTVFLIMRHWTFKRQEAADGGP